jgi:tetratricopeptide (TPR) repeat protein
MTGKIKEFLSEAEKHPSSNYYNLMSELLVWQRRSDEAIASAGRAIALDPSNPWAYEQMSYALALNGRAADARDYLAAAARVDPQPNPSRHFLAGLIAFCMEEPLKNLGPTTTDAIGCTCLRPRTRISATPARRQPPGPSWKPLGGTRARGTRAGLPPWTSLHSSSKATSSACGKA